MLANFGIGTLARVRQRGVQQSGADASRVAVVARVAASLAHHARAVDR